MHPWWLWLHLFSLDAPLVALAWQQWWARVAGVRLSWVYNVILGGGVWLIYLADRLADTATHAPGGHSTARHGFYRRRNQRQFVGPVAAVVFFGLAWLAPSRLPVGRFLAGLGLLAAAGGYFWMIHRHPRRGWLRLLPKEAVVGGIFMAGTAFFVLGSGNTPAAEWWGALVLFGVLCFLNCALITSWECNPLDRDDPTSLLNAFPGLTAHLKAACLCLAASALTAALATPHGGVFAPLLLSALLLAALDQWSDRFSADALRMLVDMVLLTPCLCFLSLP